MLNLKRGKGFQKSAANPLLKTLLEGRKIRAVHFRSLSSRAQNSVLSSWRVKAFQCNNHIVIHLDASLRGGIIGRLECGRTQLEISEELGIAQSVISRL
ncbi:hypothetical protein TNCV_1117311 [Trichonephila clavipes]|nr:hypothetical protein TNCV_1117311 [Trichonephila clavipes]